MKEKMKKLIHSLWYHAKLAMVMNAHYNGLAAPIMNTHDLQRIGIVASSLNPRVCRAEAYGACVCSKCEIK